MVYNGDPDWELGKVVKYMRPNPIGEDAYLKPDGSVEFDENKIKKAQRIFKHNYYKPEGKGAKKVLEKYVSSTTHE